MNKKQIPSYRGMERPVKGKYPNQTLKLLIQRASCRSFSDKKIPSYILQFILEAGIHSPSGGNLQPYSIIKIEDEKTKQKLAKLCGNQQFIAKAPVNLLFCIDFHRLERWARLTIAPFTAPSSFRHFWISFQDTIICAQNICTAADSLGLGSVYIGTVLECFRELRKMFKLPPGVFPVVLLCLGYPKIKPKPARKLGVKEIVHAEKYHHLKKDELIKALDEKHINRQREITGKNLKKITDVCRKVKGEEFARKCANKIKDQGYINAAQYYFGLHYCADSMPAGNDTYLKIMEEFGFNWFKKYKQLKRKQKTKKENEIRF
jgi:nitroreductase